MTVAIVDEAQVDTSIELTTDEAARLGELETAFEKIVATVTEGVGILAEIHDRKLYRQTHSTFSAYLADRWSISRARGYQLLNHAAVLERVCTTVDISETVTLTPIVGPNERQARELAKAPIDKQGEIWAEIVKSTGGSPTMQAVKDAVTPHRVNPDPHKQVRRIREDWQAQLAAQSAAPIVDAEVVAPTGRKVDPEVVEQLRNEMVEVRARYAQSGPASELVAPTPTHAVDLTFGDAQAVWNRAFEIAGRQPDAEHINQALADVAPTDVGTAYVTSCGVDNSFSYAMKTLRSDLHGLTHDPSPQQAIRLRELLSRYLAKLS